MKKPSDMQDLDFLREKLIGLGEGSFRKSYYPELQDRLQDLERFRALLDQSNDIIFLIEIPSRRLTDINLSSCRQLGYARDEFLTRLIDDLLAAGDKDALVQLFSNCETGESSPVMVDTMLRKRSGDLIPVEAAIRQVAFNNIMYAVMVARDVSERQAAQEKIRRQNRELHLANQELSASYKAVEALAEELEESQQNLISVNSQLTASQEQLAMALWGARAGLWDWQIVEGKFIYNQRYADMYGYESQSREQDILQWEKSINPDDWPAVQEIVYSHLEGRTPYYEAEYRIEGKDGEWVWVLDSGKVVSRDENGQALRAVGIVQEITGRKQVEQALAGSKAIYEGIFTATSNPVFLMDVHNFSILDANPAAQRIFAYNISELRHMKGTFLSNTDPEHSSRLLREQVDLAIAQGAATIKDIAQKKSGELIPIMITFSIIPVDEQNIVMMVVFDLSEEVRYRQEREKAARYEAQVLKMTTMSMMSAGVVHEISQPLNAIKVLSDGMLFWQEMGRDVDTLKAMDSFKKISLQADRINDIIRHMRNLASTGEDLAASPSDLNSAISGTMQMLGRQLAVHGIEMELKLAQNLPSILGQEERMEEIIINLVVNAMHALDELERNNKKILCTTRQQDNKVILEISDNGPGISPEVGHQIWEPFFSTRKGGKGMGLGLVIVQSIVSSLGGSIGYYNNEWGGATFYLELPAVLG